ncbi:MAG: PLP-dependent transferase, partial [Chloroflexota bacterium]|nr:PLP-dependent transferase [Chloroflexota bacterium]
MAAPHQHRSTAVLRAGFDPQLSVGSARPAVFKTSTYVFSSPEAAERAFAIAHGAPPEPGEDVNLIYARLSHPNAEIVEQQLVQIGEGAAAAAVFNTGMAAISTLLLTCCASGDTVIYTLPLYGGSEGFIADTLARFDIRSVGIPAGDQAALEAALQSSPRARLVFIETPANPTLVMTDIAGAVRAAAAHPNRPLVVIDDTLLGPVYQHPLALGAHLAVYSATKYMGGHSDLLAGVVMGRDPDLVTRIREQRTLLGTILQPDEAWLLGERIPTMQLRMRQQSKNAAKIVEHLRGHRAIARIHYPSAFTDPEQIRIRDAQTQYPGGLFSLDLVGGKPAAFTFLRSLRVVYHAVSLGSVETLVTHPASTTHSGLPPEALARAGVTPGLVRISVGV